MSENYLEIQLDQQPIELCKLLKVANLVTGGGEAKVVISEGYVSLNGEIEYQKRKKIYHNDIVEFNGEMLQIIVNKNLENTFSEEKLEQNTQTKNTSRFIDRQNEDSTAASNNENPPKNNKRKPISF